MFHFEPSSYGPEIAAILGDGRKLLLLTHGKPDERFRAAIEAVDVSAEVRAGLWAYHDFWTEAHTVAQDIDSPVGSHWHAIVHRREPDAGNSSYWYRRIGKHPAIYELTRRAAGLGFPNWSPERFISACETGENTNALQAVQLLEWQLLFDWCAG